MTKKKQGGKYSPPSGAASLGKANTPPGRLVMEGRTVTVDG